MVAADWCCITISADDVSECIGDRTGGLHDLPEDGLGFVRVVTGRARRG